MHKAGVSRRSLAKALCVSVVIVIVLLVAVGICTSGTSEPATGPTPNNEPTAVPTETPQGTAEPTLQPTATSRPAPETTPVSNIQISEGIKEIVVNTILGYELVEDAAVVQDGRDISLVLVVGYATNEDHAKELGNNFVRLVKSLSQDDPPGKAIGSGIYNYLIGVYYPNEERVALGAKASIAENISW